ncbi:hypothetical protein ABH19_07860 [Leptospirillum sp. Group II 'CF-1']|nr:hypothetical protein ABH19_07860 [Leptospirillum sp. Group II 'CF-1']
MDFLVKKVHGQEGFLPPLFFSVKIGKNVKFSMGRRQGLVGQRGRTERKRGLCKRVGRKEERETPGLVLSGSSEDPGFIRWKG